MIAYRPHRGLLSESMSLMQTFDSQEEMFAYIEETERDLLNDLARYNGLVSDQEIKNKRLVVDEMVTYDPRCNWNTHYVLSYGNVIGMCDLDYKKN